MKHCATCGSELSRYRPDETRKQTSLVCIACHDERIARRLQVRLGAALRTDPDQIKALLLQKHIHPAGDCEVWDSRCTRPGYPVAYRLIDGRQVPFDVTEAVFCWSCDAVPAGHQLVHTCGNRQCVRVAPGHVEAVKVQAAPPPLTLTVDSMVA